jgi:hypothetical protein
VALNVDLARPLFGGRFSRPAFRVGRNADLRELVVGLLPPRTPMLLARRLTPNPVLFIPGWCSGSGCGRAWRDPGRPDAGYSEDHLRQVAPAKGPGTLRRRRIAASPPACMEWRTAHRGSNTSAPDNLRHPVRSCRKRMIVELSAFHGSRKAEAGAASREVPIANNRKKIYCSGDRVLVAAS